MNAIPELIGGAAAVLAVTGVWCNNKRLRVCFIIFMASNSMSCGLHVYAGLWSLVARDVAFLALAVHGWRCWGKKAI